MRMRVMAPFAARDRKAPIQDLSPIRNHLHGTVSGRKSVGVVKKWHIGPFGSDEVYGLSDCILQLVIEFEVARLGFLIPPAHDGPKESGEIC